MVVLEWGRDCFQRNRECLCMFVSGKGPGCIMGHPCLLDRGTEIGRLMWIWLWDRWGGEWENVGLVMWLQ